VNTTASAHPGRLGQPWVQEVVPGVFRVGTTFLGCYVVEDAGACTFIDVGLPGYWLHLVGHFLRNGVARTAPVAEASGFGDEEILDVPGRPRVIHAWPHRRKRGLEPGRRWVLPAHGLPWEGSPRQAVKLARQLAARYPSGRRDG
jgi:glyoxylase-like metal-dependent hydrolase (beta-lactamase superfamily II)